ncbi:hypothetical protein LTR36_003171 [Oleoguttula mirabilis]|uniref:G-protein coupled receptors family 2 profile 2 domain-containing protein n=1 Tax=Oleoguttula mirabilis TaxID=1507867 RepID=A0AAV9JXW7_9PEZI|nr:hypothetical protein LTR36_003171 [Oleoguttula mirabilis]
MVFMLVSYLVLPATQTRSHYLSVCLIVSVMFISIGFTIPLAAEPEQCYNEITPNDMYSSNVCAWNGAFIAAGGLCATMWVFIRALSMNLQICWDIVPGKSFFYVSQTLGWGIPAALFTTTMTVTGVSFRFGNACLLNHKDSMADFWGPLLGLACAAGILQLATFGYCIHVYLKNLWSDQAQASSAASDSGLPSYTSSVRTQTARAVYQRLKKVLWLQWRGICIVSIILVDVIFFSIVFVYLDGLQTAVTKDWQKVEPWLECLVLNPGNKDACLSMIDGWLVSEPTFVAVLIMLSLASIQCFIFLTRPSVFSAWVDFLRTKFSPHRQEFVSLDARQTDVMRSNSKQQLLKYDHVRGHQSTTFEMQKPGTLQTSDLDLDSKSPTHTVLSSPDEAYKSPLQYPYDTPELEAGRSVSPTFAGLSRGRIPPEYVGSVTPDLSNTGLPSPPTPAVSYNAISLHRQPSDYFAQHQRRAYAREASTESVEAQPGRSSAGSQRPASHERRYNPPNSSFSAPKTPSRQSSVKSVAFADPRETYGRGGLALNPPSEAGESQEDLTQSPRGQSLDRR